MLETTNQTIISSLALPEKQPKSKAEQMFEALKKTPLYDPETNQWNWRMAENQELRDSDRDADAQLLAVLVEAQFDKHQAQEIYQALKQTPLYDPERNQWNWSMKENQKLLGSGRPADAQLLAVLVEAQFDKQQAQETYQALKKTPLYDPETNQWNWSMTENQEHKDIDRLAHAQLLAVLVEALFDKQQAKKDYQALRQTPLYDPERNQWNWSMKENQKLENSNRFVNTQLLAILAETLFDKLQAQETYQVLKQTPFYDPETNQWNWFMNENQELRSSARYAHVQLLGVLVENLFEEPELEEPIPELPEIRRF